MRMLIADPDRDLLLCLGEYFEKNANEVVSCFDGAQAMTLITGSRFDYIVLNRKMPRVGTSELLKFSNSHGIPSTVMLDKKLDLKTLSAPEVACSYIAFPFTPDELAANVEKVYEKSRSGKTIEICGAKIDVFRFTLSESDARFTSEELDMLEKLKNAEYASFDFPCVYVGDINRKFKEAGKNIQIKYYFGKGYKAVREDE